MTSPNPPRPNLSALGWLLAVPALLGALITLLLPTVQTLWLSFQSGGVMRESAYAGTANYADLLGDGAFWRALGFTLSLTLLPLLVAVVVAPLLALALDRAGAWPRRAGRVVLSLAVVTFSPVAVAGAWTRGLSPESSGLAALAQGLREPGTAPWTLRLIVAAGTFGIVCALAVLAYLPALRGGSAVPATLAVAALVLLATVATGVQTFSIGMVLTRGGPQHATETLAGLQYDYAFRMARFGPGAAVAALSGVILGVLGVVATLVAVLSRLRITLTPRLKPAQGAPALKGGPVPHDPFGTPGASGPHGGPVSHGEAAYHGGAHARHGAPGGAHAPQGGPVPHGEAAPYGGAQAPQGVPASHGSPAAPGGVYGAGIGSPAAPGRAYGAAVGRRTAGPGWVAAGAVALLIFAAAWVLLSWPWIDGVLATPSAPASTLRTHVNTWVPALAGALVSVGVAYLAALGIGGLRPLGRGSEWLLLAFAPWLFVGPGPLGVANWQNARNLGLIDSFPALVPPLLVSVPALLVLTLLCKGLSERSGGDFFGGVLLPSLPMAGILAGAVTLVNAHDLSWPLLVAQQADAYTTPVSQVTRLGSFAGGTPDIGAATPLLVVAVALAALVAAQLLYLDRLAVTTNGSPVRTDAA
ncbi:hypothetical protein AB0M50_51830 [Nonomuraea fuscirosea]|uniref:hypothetical protein n=1 Tax=Nonomuraea fuscirosea TaxID=1291556 RepID=UPI0034279FE8